MLLWAGLRLTLSLQLSSCLSPMPGHGLVRPDHLLLSACCSDGPWCSLSFWHCSHHPGSSPFFPDFLGFWFLQGGRLREA